MTPAQIGASLAVGAYLVALAVVMPSVVIDAAIIGGFLAVCVLLTLAFGERVAE